MDSDLKQVTPVLHVGDAGEAAAFFRDILGFEVQSAFGGYAYVSRGPVGIRLMDSTIYGPPGPGQRRYHVYIDVADVDALRAELAPRLAGLPADHLHGPADKDYGMRELCVLGPDGEFIVFGQDLAPD